MIYNRFNANFGELHEILFNLHSDSPELVHCRQRYGLSMHTRINPYLPKQTYFINTGREITDGFQLNGRGRMETRMRREGEEMRQDRKGARTRQVTGRKSRKRWREWNENKSWERWRRRKRSGQRGEGRLESDSCRCVRGPYSFRHELSGGMRVRER